MLFLCLTSTNGHSFQTDAQMLDKILADIAEQNTEALARLYEKTSTNVYSFALSILKNAQDAEDVLQDCFMNIYAAAGEYRSVGKPLAWILTITKNLCLKKLRERKKTAEDGFDQLDQLETAFSENDAIGAEDKLVLMACMRFLTDQERQIVVLHIVSGFRHREIAQLLSLHLSTVLSKYNRALKKLKKYLTEGAQIG